MDLFAPGMSPMHRIGLGGLACTLDALQCAFTENKISESDLPARFQAGIPPWEITEETITLHFKKPERAADYLRKLFEFGFGIQTEGLIYLPGQFKGKVDLPVLADLQTGMMLTFLQHGSSRKIEKQESTVHYLCPADEKLKIPVIFRKCTWFKHQAGWKELVGASGCLKNQPVKLDGSIYPGAAVRHFAYKNQSAFKEPLEQILPLFFSLVGCLSLPVNRGVGVLLAPEVRNLQDFIRIRPMLNPANAHQHRATNLEDAILQAKLRTNPQWGFYAIKFQPTPWGSQQKSRVHTCHVGPVDNSVMLKYQRVYESLPPRTVADSSKPKAHHRPNSIEEDPQTGFRVDSVVRPLIATNLAKQSPWYSGFTTLMTKNNPATGKPFRNQLSFESKGINQMISDSSMWDEEGESLLVRAIHEAIRQTLGRIRSETDGVNSLTAGTQVRWNRFREKLRLDLAGSKTSGQLRFVLVDLFSRGKTNPTLQSEWSKILPVIRADWQLARDLSLLALASYASHHTENNRLNQIA